MGWIIFGEANHNNTKMMSKYAPDLARDPFYVWLNNWHWVPMVILGGILYAIGGLPVFLWGIFLRVTLGLHSTWLVNSATHMFGSRRFETRDDSRNSWWVALLTFGEGWHNNHHAHPTSARHGLAWYEVDISWMTLKVMRALGIAKNITVAQLPEKKPIVRLPRNSSSRSRHPRATRHHSSLPTADCKRTQPDSRLPRRSRIFFNKEFGRNRSKNSFSNSAKGRPALNSETKVSTPSVSVGPGNTAFEVMPVPAQISAIPRDTASNAVFVMP